MTLQLSEDQIIDGRYQIERKIGEGAAGAVYLARDMDLDRKVAIKVLLAAPGLESDAEKRFEREARILSELLHPNIVRVFRFSYLENKIPFLILEYVEGESLRSFLDKNKPLPCHLALNLMQQLCSALAYAHSAGIVHRDLKPENILLVNNADELTVKLADFGLGKQVAESQQDQLRTLTQTGSIVGTPLYMSPEQCVGKPADARSDIYSFACILFEMITGRPPFMANSQGEILLKHLSEPMPRIFDLAPDSKLPKDLENLILKASEKNKEERYENCALMQKQIEELLKLDCREVFRQAKSTARTRSIPKPSPKVLIAVLLVLISSGGVSAFYIFGTEAGSDVQTVFYLNNLSADNCSAKLSEAFRKALTDSKPQLALKLAAITSNSPRFKSWLPQDRIRLLESFTKDLEGAGLKEEAFDMKLKLLQELLILVQEAKIRPRFRENIDRQREKLASLSQELYFLDKSKNEWTEISHAIENAWRTPTGAWPVPVWLGVLRCESRRIKGVTEADISPLAKNYCFAASLASAAGDLRALQILVKNGTPLAVEGANYNRANTLHITLSEFYLKRGQLDKAKEELQIALSYSNGHPLSGAETSAQERQVEGVRRGYYVTPKRKSGTVPYKKPMPVIYQQVLGEK